MLIGKELDKTLGTLNSDKDKAVGGSLKIFYVHKKQHLFYAQNLLGFFFQQNFNIVLWLHHYEHSGSKDGFFVLSL